MKIYTTVTENNDSKNQKDNENVTLNYITLPFFLDNIYIPFF